MRRLIFIHGINNESRSRAQIEDLWLGALKSTLGAKAASIWDSVEVRTAYYAQELHAHEQSWGQTEPSGARMSADSPDEDFASGDIAALFMEMQQAHGISDDAVAAELAPGEDRAAATRMAAGIHKSWLKAIARTLEKVVPSAGNGLARAFLAQAAAYLNKPGVYDEINGIVRDQVFGDLGDTSRTVVIGHSLGTIVSYVLMRSLGETPGFPLYLTIGSPLGIKIVRKRVGMPYITPPPLGTWINGSDREDFVALHPALTAETFGPAAVRNIVDLDNGHADAHAAENYLAQPVIANAIFDALA